jgi:hypothetical protein
MIQKPFIQLILIHVREFYREPAVSFLVISVSNTNGLGIGIAFNKKPELTKTVALVLNETISVESLKIN